jgi:predicted tellurium resistance membrane protein TerC
VLGFIGIKMMLHQHIEVPDLLSLSIILIFLGIGVAASWWSNKREAARLPLTERKGK